MKAISQTLESQILLYDGRRQQNCSTIYRVKNELLHLFFYIVINASMSFKYLFFYFFIYFL